MASPKENRSDWVAVAPEHDVSSLLPPIVKAKTAYQYFQKHTMAVVKREHPSMELGAIMKEVGRRWQELSTEEKQPFLALAADDQSRFLQASRERDQLVETQRQEKRASFTTVEGKRERKPKVEVISTARKSSRVLTESERQVKQQRATQRQVAKDERMELKQEEQRQKDALREKKASMAHIRLKYLLSQSDVFAHFGKKGKAVAPHRLSEQEEDASLLQESPAIVRMSSQPSIIEFGKMRPYQLEGLSWMVNLAHQGINGILADEMGLGKTLQTISVLAWFAEYEKKTGPHLVMVPKSTLSNWLMEFQRWCPSLRVIKFHGNQQERTEVITQILCPGVVPRHFDVCLTTFEMCMKEHSTLSKFAWHYLIIDEAHRIKNEASQFSQIVRVFETEHRLLLTGTPLQNNLHELWALLNFLLPDVFEKADEFDAWFNLQVDDDEMKQQMISQLHKILKPFMLRRLKVDVEKTLPPKKETLLFVGMSAMQKQLYKSLLLRDMTTIMGGGGSGNANSTVGVSKSALQNIVMQLRKCCGHPYLFEGQEDRSLDPLGEHVVENCGKMVLCDKLLKKLKQRGSRVLLFTQMTRVLDIMEDFCRMRGYEYCRIDGQTTYEDRESSIEAFNQEGSSKFIFLLSTRAGGLGINLYTADVVILYDSDWNPQADLQAQDRAHRIGQKKEVNVYRLVTADSVEEKIIERAQQKLKLDAMVVQQGRLQEKAATKLSKQEMLSMIRFGADQVFRSTDSTITDEDIDAILAKGEQRTEEMMEKLQVHDKGDLLDFKLDGGTLQQHDGVDYSNEKERQEEFKRLADAELARQLMESMNTKRERRQVSNEVVKQSLIPKDLRLIRMEEWQFYNRVRLTELNELEYINYQQLEGEKTGPYLTPEQTAEKEQLLAQGFREWNKPIFFLYIKLMARHGRKNLVAVAREMGKPLDEIERYSRLFFERGPTELSDWSRIIKLIEKGESKLLEIERFITHTAKKIARYDNPWEDMPVHFQGKSGKSYTEDEDRVLLCLVHKFGYGAWEKIKMEIQRLDCFTFDYYLRSRTAVEIGRRCDSLMRMCEKDNMDFEVKEKKEVELRQSLISQRQALDQKLVVAKQELKQQQQRVDTLIMKEAKRMQAQREEKRAKKKRKEQDLHDVQVEAHEEQLRSFLLKSTSLDAAKVAMDFCAQVKMEKNEELQASYVLKKIREMGEPLTHVSKGQLAWKLKDDYVPPTNRKSKVSKHEKTGDVKSGRLPKSPWSPRAMKQKGKKEGGNTKSKTKAANANGVMIRKPRSAYVLFSIEKRSEVKATMPEGVHMVEVMALLSQMWKGMSEVEREPWVVAAKEDKVRYEREMNGMKEEERNKREEQEQKEQVTVPSQE